MADLTRQVGKLFLVGFPGETPPSAFLDFVREVQLGGVILFAENCTGHSAIRQNIETINSCLRTAPPFIAIDQEGGRVCRIKGAPAEYKAAGEYGRNGQLERFVEDYTRSAVYLESLGINLNLAPVCDIHLRDDSTCLADRCFGSDPGTVSLFVKTSIAVAHKSGILTCLKHFPGLGAAVNDPHEKTAVADYDIYQWKSREMIPFSDGIGVGADLIMTTHMHVPRIDDTIVTGSQKIISEMIRLLLAFDGPVITDDLTMEGASVLGNIGERTVAAFNAGHDILLFGRDYEAAMRAYDFFVDAFLRGEISKERVTAALDRVAGIKYKLVALSPSVK